MCCEFQQILEKIFGILEDSRSNPTRHLHLVPLRQHRLWLSARESAKTVLERDTVDRLVAMAGCDNVDVQREGSAALAAISQSNSQQLSASLPQLVPLLRKLMLANDEELCRNACVFLANLCVSEACRAEVVKSLLMNMLNLLTEPGHMGRRDSKRHVARALFECSKTPCGVSALSPHVSILQGYRDTQDSALQGSIRGTLAHLKVC